MKVSGRQLSFPQEETPPLFTSLGPKLSLHPDPISLEELPFREMFF